MEYRGLPLDAFQQQAIEALDAGRSVLVSAPTGTGKTLIADWIVEQALDEGKRVVYTAPIKALSNQKFRDYRRLYGDDAVGLVTGDLVIRRDAPCRVMTTEILRNMLLADEPMDDLKAVIIDEIHFLDDRERGTTWEEVLIYLPTHVQIVGLSATLSNLRQFAGWLESVRDAPVEVVLQFRPFSRRTRPMKTGFAALKFGATLVLMPFTFVYVPEILLQGTWPEIVFASTFYAVGSVAFAIFLQGSAPVGGRVATLPRALFGLSAALLLFPSGWVLNLAGVVAGLSAMLVASALPGARGQSAGHR